jgi:gliding motility-associated-like protein
MIFKLVLFTNVFPGIYTAFVRDIVHAIKPLIVTIYARLPSFFTPNEDSINDLWTIKNLDLFPQATITIFNRYGKLLKWVQQVWVGTFNGSKLPAADYWNLTLKTEKSYKGHFSLKDNVFYYVYLMKNIILLFFTFISINCFAQFSKTHYIRLWLHKII